jgi:D-3-phosphoglycerate dehydrogenase
MVREVAIRISENISDSIKENISFFGKNRENIYIISGGFKYLILPTARKLEILDSNIMANELLFNKEGNFVDINKDNLMAQEKGKVKQMKKMDLGKDVFMVGDGWTDYETKESGVASKFVAFVENVRREKILEKADLVAENFYQVIEYVENN